MFSSDSACTKSRPQKPTSYTESYPHSIHPSLQFIHHKSRKRIYSHPLSFSARVERASAKRQARRNTLLTRATQKPLAVRINIFRVCLAQWLARLEVVRKAYLRTPVPVRSSNLLGSCWWALTSVRPYFLFSYSIELSLRFFFLAQIILKYYTKER